MIGEESNIWNSGTTMNDDDELEPQGFMPRSNRPYGFPVSRDWEDIDCRATGCRYNLNEKCGVPSLAKIGEDGRCTGFTPRPIPKTIDGD